MDDWNAFVHVLSGTEDHLENPLSEVSNGDISDQDVKGHKVEVVDKDYPEVARGDQAEHRDDAESSAQRSMPKQDEKLNEAAQKPAASSLPNKNSENSLSAISGWCQPNEVESTGANGEGEHGERRQGNENPAGSREDQGNTACVPAIGEWCFTGRETTATEDENEIRVRAPNESKDARTISSESTSSQGGQNMMTKRVSRSITPKSGNVQNGANDRTTNTRKGQTGANSGSRLQPEMETTAQETKVFTMSADNWLFSNGAFPSLSLSTTTVK